MNNSEATGYSIPPAGRGLIGGLMGADVAVKDTAISSSHSTFELAAGLATRVTNLVNRLAGTTPELTGSRDNKPDTDGILHGLREHSVDCRRRIQEAHNAIDRLESML